VSSTDQGRNLRVSLIMTLLNEAESLPALFASIAFQSRPPDQIVVVDAGSSDATLTLLAEYAINLPVQVVSAPGVNIAQGRNLAIAAAEGEVIAATDGGVRLSREWLAELIAPFSEASVQAVSGFFQADPQTTFEVALGATTLPDLAEIEPAHFLPSSRSIAFRKTAWQTVGGYPEWLDYCEDLLFDFALRAYTGAPFPFAAAAVASYRPRSNLRSFWRQYYRYARGDGKADLWRRRHTIRYATYTLGPLLAGLAMFKPQRFGWLGYLLLAGAATYCATPYRRLWPRLTTLAPLQRLAAVALVPLIRLVGDVAKLAGYPVGVWWRLRGRRRSP